MINNLDECTKVVINEHFFILDDIENTPAYIKHDNGQFEVINDFKKKIYFVQIDNCIYTSSDESRCDCAIYTDEVFCFIELKTCKIRNQKENRKKAQKQLKTTIQKYKNEQILQNKRWEAYICMTCNHDGKLTKITNAINKSAMVEFEDELNTSLYYECKKNLNT